MHIGEDYRRRLGEDRRRLVEKEEHQQPAVKMYAYFWYSTCHYIITKGTYLGRRYEGITSRS